MMETREVVVGGITHTVQVDVDDRDVQVGSGPGGDGSNDGRVNQEAIDAAVAAGVAAYRERDAAARAADGYGTFDPAADGVKATDVHSYLSGLDVETDAGAAEYERVVTAEKAGADRSSAIPA